jgi:hypothetical protein
LPIVPSCVNKVSINPIIQSKTPSIVTLTSDNIVTVRLKRLVTNINSKSLRNVQCYSYGNEKPIVTSDATEALLGQKLSNGITVDGYRGIAEKQIKSVVSEQATSQIS